MTINGVFVSQSVDRYQNPLNVEVSFNISNFCRNIFLFLVRRDTRLFVLLVSGEATILHRTSLSNNSIKLIQ